MAAAIVGIIVRSSKTIRSARTTALAAEIEHIVRIPWSVAFRAGMPDVTAFEQSWHETREIYEWLKDRGAADYEVTKLKLRLTGQSDDVVQLVNIRAKVSRSAPYTATLVSHGTAGA
ncbi:MAG: hypothetical protein JOY57_03895, partial [Actinobacteria bacterium]|nr:hypothetical protein [Actinomycetota bacterium]